jgi:hypothetical protein
MSTRSRGQISAFERLRDLPALFRGGDLTRRFGWSSKSASQYLYLWKRRGLVESLGGHSDVYANLLASRHPDWERAVTMAMPSAVLVGIEVLRRAGWTTQLPPRPTVAIKAGHAVFKTDRFDVATRTPRWFDQVAPGILGESPHELRALRPAWALADHLKDGGWERGGLSPDDIEWSQISRAHERDWREACAALQLPRIALRDMAVAGRAHQPRESDEGPSGRKPARRLSGVRTAH